MKPNTETIDLKTLIQQVQLGQPEAYTLVVQRFRAMAVGYSYARLGDLDLAEDVAQEAFISAYYHLPELRDAAAFPGWFRRILSTQVNRLQRDQRMRLVPLEQALTLAAASPEPFDLAAKRDLQRRVITAIQTLPEPQRIVVLLFYIGQYPQTEISAFLDIPVATVKTRLHNARKRLKPKMMNFIQTVSDQTPFIKERIMKLNLATVLACATSGCQVRLIPTDEVIDTRYCLQMQDRIKVRPRQLIVVDQEPTPARTVYRLYRSRVKKIEGAQIYVERADLPAQIHRGDPYQAHIVEGLEITLQVGDEVWGRNEIYGLVKNDQPANPERLLAQLTPLVNRIFENDSFQPDPNSAATHTNRANVYQDQGDYERAIAVYGEALALNPRYVQAYVNRGHAYKHWGRATEAKADFEQALALLDQPTLDIQPANHPDLYWPTLDDLQTWIKHSRRRVEKHLQALQG